MSTINDKKIIKHLLENDGNYSDDPQCDNIWSYIAVLSKKKTYAVYYKPFFLEESQFVKEPLLLWSKDVRPHLTMQGEEELAELRKSDI